MEESKKTRLIEYCQKFIKEQEITGSEAIFQCDNVILNAYEFIEGICDIVGYHAIED